MARIHISNDPSGHIIVSFPYDPLLVSKVKTIDGHRWHPAEKHWSFPNNPYPPPRWGREKEGVKKLESELSPRFAFEDLQKIRSPLDNLNLEGGDIDKI
jgi:hypothetical protein